MVRIIATRSPPSSTTMFGFVSVSAFSRKSSYSSAVQAWVAKTFTPSSTSAAATSSWVESGLLPVTVTSAPAFFSTSARYAVFASRWIVSTMRQPLKGFVFEYSSSILFSTGMKFLTQAILSCPDGASFISRTIDSMLFPPVLRCGPAFSRTSPHTLHSYFIII